MEVREYQFTRLAVGVVYTIMAPCTDISYYAVERSSRNIFTAGVIIDNYITCLRVWKFYNNMRKSSNINDLTEYLYKIRNDSCIMIASHVMRNVFEKNILFQAMPDMINNFREGKQSITRYISELCPRRLS